MNNLFEYKQEMNNLRFTPEQKVRLAEIAAEAASGEKRRSRRPFGKIVMLAACLAIVLAASAGAAGVLQSAVDAFSPLFGGTVAQTEVIEKIGHPIGASDSDNGITVTADAIMGDPYNVVMVYTFSRTDGEPFLPEGREASCLMVDSENGILRNNGGAHGVMGFTDTDPTDNTVQYFEYISSTVAVNEKGAAPLIQGTVNAEFRNIKCYNSETETYEPLYKGHWKMRFAMEYEDVSVQLAQGESFTQDGITFTVNNLTVSPLGIYVGYTADEEVVWSNSGSGREDPEDSRQIDRFIENIELLVTKTDGSVLKVNTGGSINPENGVTICTKSDIFSEIIPLEEMESISIGGVVYSVNAQ